MRRAALKDKDPGVCSAAAYAIAKVKTAKANGSAVAVMMQAFKDNQPCGQGLSIHAGDDFAERGERNTLELAKLRNEKCKRTLASARMPPASWA